MMTTGRPRWADQLANCTLRFALGALLLLSAVAFVPASALTIVPPPPPAPPVAAMFMVPPPPPPAAPPVAVVPQSPPPPAPRLAAFVASVQSAASANLRRPMAGNSRIPCVQFVRGTTSFRLTGNAHLWWPRAAGVHARGNVPEIGSILSFPSIRKMPMGHVAVVSCVISSREIEIDHSNWVDRGVIIGAEVIDVSPRNDWTAVRVSLKPGAKAYGSIYPTNGFIYARPFGSPIIRLAEHPTDLGVAPLTGERTELRGNARRDPG